MTTMTASPTLASRVWPSSSALRSAVLVLSGTCALALAARVQIPFWPVPATMQTFAVLVIGMAYGPRLGLATAGTYLLQGALGLPVFAQGAGPAYFAGPTGGYLVGFLLAAGVMGSLAHRGWDRSFLLTLAGMTLGTAVILACGCLWLSVYWTVGAYEGDAGRALAYAATVGVVPFIPAALAKIVLAAAVMPTVWKALGRDRSTA